MLLVVVILIFFLYDVRSGLIVAVTIPLSLLFAFACLDLQGASANLLSIGAIDFGILVDAAVIMVENIYRRLAESEDGPAGLMTVIRDAAAEVDRPLFYSVVVIVVSFLPIYVLAGPSGVLFKPMADTMIFALIGSLIVTLTLLPVLCFWLLRSGVRERRNAIFERIRTAYVRGLDFCLARSRATVLATAALLVASLLLFADVGAEFMPHLDEGALWVRATMPYTISFDESAKIVPQRRPGRSCRSPPAPRRRAAHRAREGQRQSMGKPTLQVRFFPSCNDGFGPYKTEEFTAIGGECHAGNLTQTLS